MALLRLQNNRTSNKLNFWQPCVLFSALKHQSWLFIILSNNAFSEKLHTQNKTKQENFFAIFTYNAAYSCGMGTSIISVEKKCVCVCVQNRIKQSEE